MSWRRERRGPYVPALKFIEAWQTSETVTEVLRKLRMRRSPCMLRAKRYRERGVPLKELDPGYAHAGTYVGQWEDLAEYAQELLRERQPLRSAKTEAPIGREELP